RALQDCNQIHKPSPDFLTVSVFLVHHFPFQPLANTSLFLSISSFCKDWDCGYSPHHKELLLLILLVDINYDVGYRSGNTLRFPRVTREPPWTVVLWGLTLATIPAGVSVYFLR